MIKECISYALLCNCGNTPDAEGIWPYDAEGNDEKSSLSADGSYFACDRCGRIIDGDTLEVVGYRKPQTNSVASF